MIGFVLILLLEILLKVFRLQGIGQVSKSVLQCKLLKRVYKDTQRCTSSVCKGLYYTLYAVIEFLSATGIIQYSEATEVVHLGIMYRGDVQFVNGLGRETAINLEQVQCKKDSCDSMMSIMNLLWKRKSEHITDVICLHNREEGQYERSRGLYTLYIG